MKIKQIIERKNEFLNKTIEVSGWIRFNRVSKNLGFIELFDGSYLNGIQLVYKLENNLVFETLSKATSFSALTILGTLTSGRNDLPEIHVEKIKSFHKSKEDYSLGKKEHGLEFLRENSHLRIRTKLFQSIMKIRSTAFLAIHEFFEKEKWINVTTPIITSNDAEGAGESFNIKTSDNKTFFSEQGKLTVSGQLHAETYAQSLGNVYTFGPTFRAEKSNTPKHVAEFWMLEPEATWKDYHEMMEISSNLISFISKKVWNNSKDEIDFLSKYNEKDLIENVYKNLSMSNIKKIKYSQAIEILKEAQNNGFKFINNDLEFGIDLSTEHERYLSENYAKGPIFVYDYPTKIKAFYMYRNDDQTVRGFDLLVPGIGELIGGSQREDRIEVLRKTINEKNLDTSSLDWYIEMREEGYAPSSGFGLGFERLIMLLTGMENIRDVIPYPRTTGKLLY